MSFIHSIPKAVFASVISEWIDMSVLMIFDTAMCNELGRQYLLQIYQLPSFCVNQDVDYLFSIHFKWMNLRNIKPSSLIIRPTSICDKKLKYDLDLSHLKSIEICQFNKSQLKKNELTNILNSCTQLEEMIFQ